MPPWMRIASRSVQGLLYVLLAAAPLTAVAAAHAAAALYHHLVLKDRVLRTMLPL